MRDQSVTAPTGRRHSEVLSADNSRPDRFTLIEMVRRASTALQLKPTAIATLEALLSCLPPKRNHDFVFASNATLVFRRNGISERTLRRHIAQLIDLGFLERADSPNRKRFTRQDASSGSVLRFGFDLTPLFQAFPQICALAQACSDAASHLAFLRSKLRAAIARTAAQTPDTPALTEARVLLRRKLAAKDLQALLDQLEPVVDYPADISDPPEEMSATAGQNDRHLHKSKKEGFDSAPPLVDIDQDVNLQTLTEACPEAASYLQHPPRHRHEVISHARTLAPMMGIDALSYDHAESRLGRMGAAVTLWSVLQMQDKIGQLGAYFRAITTGRRSEGFDPMILLDRLARQRRRLT